MSTDTPSLSIKPPHCFLSLLNHQHIYLATSIIEDHHQKDTSIHKMDQIQLHGYLFILTENMRKENMVSIINRANP